MVNLQRSICNIVSLLTLILTLPCTASRVLREVKARDCPIGFHLGTSKTREICYSLKKDPEPFTGKFDNCTGNLFTLKLYNSLGLPKSDNVTLWTDYKALYSGGPFVDWSYTDSTGDILETTYEVNRGPYVSADDQLCVAIHPVDNFTAVRCDELHYRYCFVEPYDEIIDNDGCEDLTDGERFWGPLQTCLTAVSGASAGGKGVVRATWNQSQRLCEARGGSIIGPGWRYSNYFKPADHATHILPLNIEFNPEHTILRYGGNSTEIPSSEWHFASSITFTRDNSFGAIYNDFWDLVNSSYVFYDVICERPIELKHVNLTVTVNSGDNLITLRVNDTSLENIMCFTDSSRYFPQKVSVKEHSSDEYLYILKPIENGYYWCTHADSRNFYISESNKALYVKVKESTENLYAVKIQTFGVYKLDKISKLLENVWRKKIEEYVFYSTKYTQVYEGTETYDNYTIMNFKKTSPGLHWEDRDIIQKLKLKRLYLDARTALLHVQLHPDMKPARPGQWENVIILFMKPAYYCDNEHKLSNGMSRSTPDCKVYTCVGDYNDGVQTIITPQDKCYLPTPTTVTTAVNVTEASLAISPVTPKDDTVTTNEPRLRDRSESSSSEESNKVITEEPIIITTETTYEVSTFTNEVQTATSPYRPPRPPTTPSTTEQPTTEPPTTVETTTETPEPSTTETVPTARPPPEDQLQEAISNLEDLLNNTDTVMVQDIDEALTKVDKVLLLDELDIPGNLLHLLDKIGARVNLNGSKDSSTIKQNIALLVADARPNTPVKGLRVATRDYYDDTFTNETFEIIRDDINASQLATSRSEVVVSLPDSIAASSRRISFVVFRNDRAFQSHKYAVNSRVLSVNVENVTEFHDGEVIDIHLLPLTEDLDRNQSRACAFWQFSENGTGKWSQEGCSFIRATQNGLLDTCRCNHLTHFAEVLIPRTLFSKNNEIALEILSIVGCCMSLLGLLAVALTALLFRSWRRDYSNKIWLQLCVAIFLLSFSFLVTVFANFKENNIACVLTGVVLHYAVLASFCWMLVAAVLSYRRLVLVFTRDASHKLLRAAAFAWGAPCVVVGVLLSVAPHAYSAPFEDKTPSGAFCYPSGAALWAAVYAPVVVMLLANWTLFALIVHSVFGTRRPQNHGPGANEAFRCASVSCLLVFLFGLPWIFGLFAFNLVTAYFFTILVTFQGLVLFLFFVLGNKKTRDLWLNKLKIKRTMKVPVTSSTYTNRSTGANAPPRGNPTPAAIEANASKPRSLSSSDNSRFS